MPEEEIDRIDYIEVPEVPEPDTPEDGVIAEDDDYHEGTGTYAD